MNTKPQTHTPDKAADTTDPLGILAGPDDLLGKIVAVLPESLTPLESARMVEYFIGLVQGRTVEGGKAHLAALKASDALMDAAEAARAVEVKLALADAARNERYAAEARLKAARIENEEPLAAYTKRAAIAAQQARERVEYAMSNEGRFTIDVGAEDAAEGYVNVSARHLIENGWHHRSVCGLVAPGAGAPTGVTFSPDHDLIQQVWRGGYDWHDEEHGNGLWHGCAIYPCAGIPADFRKEPWNHQEREG